MFVCVCVCVCVCFGGRSQGVAYYKNTMQTQGLFPKVTRSLGHWQSKNMVTQSQAVLEHGPTCSLGLLPPPVFDHLQYLNAEEEGLGDLVTCSDVR